MDVTFQMAQGHLDGELSWIISDILAHRHEWWVPGKIVEARHRLKHYWQVRHACAPPQSPRESLHGACSVQL